MEENLFRDTEIGSPQGGVILPRLANVYLTITIRCERSSSLMSVPWFALLVILCEKRTHALEAENVRHAEKPFLKSQVREEQPTRLRSWWSESPHHQLVDSGD
jgi:hypothetical protein